MDELKSLINQIRDANGQDPISEWSPNLRWREDLQFDSFSLAELSACVERDFEVDAFADGVPANPGELWERIQAKGQT